MPASSASPAEVEVVRVRCAESASRVCVALVDVHRCILRPLVALLASHAEADGRIAASLGTLSRVSSCRRLPAVRCRPAWLFVTLAPRASPSRPSPYGVPLPAGRGSLDVAPSARCCCGSRAWRGWPHRPGGLDSAPYSLAWSLTTDARDLVTADTVSRCVVGGKPKRARAASRRA